MCIKTGMMSWPLQSDYIEDEGMEPRQSPAEAMQIPSGSILADPSVSSPDRLEMMTWVLYKSSSPPSAAAATSEEEEDVLVGAAATASEVSDEGSSVYRSLVRPGARLSSHLPGAALSWK